MTTGLLTDGLIILVYFVIVVGIGLYKGRGSKSMEGFAVGDRNIPWWAVMASILAAEISAATFLGAPGEGYAQRNFTYAQLAIGTILARFLIAYIFIKPYYDFRVVSIYEYLLIRFGRRSKDAASAVFLLTRALASGTRLYVAAIVLVFGYELVTGHELAALQQMPVYIGALTFITAITAVYTALGGIKAVVWTDVIQATIMFGALGFAIWSLLSVIPGGMTGVHAAMNQPGDWKFFDSGIDPGRDLWGNVRSILESEYTIWAALIGSTFTTLATHGTDQDMVQRMLTAKNYHRSRLSLILSGLADLPLVLCFLFVGMLLWSYYRRPGMDAPFAHYIVYEMPPGIRGLLVAGLFATAMGSLSTALNALATSFVEDWYRPYINPGATPGHSVRAARRATVVFSILLIIVGALTAYAKIVLQARIIPIVLGIFGYTYGSLLGVFLVGLLTRGRGSERGNLIAMLFGFVVVALLSGLHNDVWALLHPVAPGVPHPVLWAPAWLPRIEFPWRIAFGSIATFCVALCFRTPAAQIAVAQEKRLAAA
ncbi:MAG: sodium:solute symporter [Terrimicrobiaceae bacterium]|nr:sodium:solute symporter [Terrimicrobiaceae bacterium]